MTRAELTRLYDLKRGMLRPDYARLANAHHIKRDPATDEISFEPSSIEQHLRDAGLI